MRPTIVACFLVFCAVGCAGTPEPEPDAVPNALLSTVQPERTGPESIRIFSQGLLPFCPYRVVREIDAGRTGDLRTELRRRAFAQKADAVILLADTGTGPVMGLAIVYTDPDCRR
jgi:hypothetical protein